MPRLTYDKDGNPVLDYSDDEPRVDSEGFGRGASVETILAQQGKLDTTFTPADNVTVPQAGINQPKPDEGPFFAPDVVTGADQRAPLLPEQSAPIGPGFPRGELSPSPPDPEGAG